MPPAAPHQQEPATASSPGEVARVRARFEKLLAAGIAISSEHSLERLLQQVADSACGVVEARYAALGVLSADGKGLAEFVTSGLTPAERERIGPPPKGHGLLGLLIKEARPIRIRDIGVHPQSYGFPLAHPPMRSFLGVPVLSRKQVFGNLYLADKIGADEFSAEDEAIAVLLAAQAAVAVENAQLLNRVQSMQRQRDQFFAMINHELRNALTGVYGWAEQMARAKSEAAKERSGREVFEAAERTITLMNNLLDLSRLDADKVQAVWRDVPLPDVMRRAIAAVRPAADAKEITIGEEYPDPLPPCRTDALRLEQIVVNLMSNAVRHSPKREAIIIRVEAGADELLLHVIDNGPGIAPERHTQIFEPFVRVDPDSGLGSGLGLPVARRLAELLGGRLTVQSAFGRGATFTVALPFTPPER